MWTITIYPENTSGEGEVAASQTRRLREFIYDALPFNLPNWPFQLGKI
jgi:hypothetical protein